MKDSKRERKVIVKVVGYVKGDDGTIKRAKKQFKIDDADLERVFELLKNAIQQEIAREFAEELEGNKNDV